MSPVLSSQVHDHVASAISVGAIVGTYMGYLPNIAAGGAIIWYGLLIFTWIINKGWIAKK